MTTALLIIQMIAALFLTLFILVQSKGTGFGRSWGGSSSFTRRGLEKVIFRGTFVVTGIFIVVSVLQLVL